MYLKHHRLLPQEMGGSRLSLSVLGLLSVCACYQPNDGPQFGSYLGNAVAADGGPDASASGGDPGAVDNGSDPGVGNVGGGGNGVTDPTTGGGTSGGTTGTTDPGGTTGGADPGGTTGGDPGGTTGGVNPGNPDAGVVNPPPPPPPPPPPNAPASLAFSVLTVTLKGNFSPRNIGAIWVENASGKYIKTLAKWARTRQGYLTAFNKASGGNVVDAVTSATLTQHTTHNVTWNLKDANGAAVPDGDYKILMELTDRNGPGDSTSVSFTKGPTPFKVSPPGATHFINMSLNYQ